MKKKNNRLLPFVTSLVLVGIVACGIWQFFAEHPLPEATEPTQLQDQEPPKPEYKAALKLGEGFEVTPLLMKGRLHCMVTQAKWITSEADCPPESWFVEKLSMKGPDDRYDTVPYDQWFSDGGPISQGVRLLTVSVMLENIDASGTEPEVDPTLLDVYNLFRLADTNLVRQDEEQSWYQPFACIGSDVFSKNIHAPAMERQCIRLFPGEKACVQLCFRVEKDTEDLQKLVLVTNSSPKTIEEYLIFLED